MREVPMRTMTTAFMLSALLTVLLAVALIEMVTSL